MAKIKEYSVVRNIAILLVVIGHCNVFADGVVFFSIKYTGWLRTVIDFICDFIYDFHMPLFFAISGAVYYANRIYKNKYDTIFEIIKNKFTRLMIPYFEVLIVLMLPLKILMGEYALSGDGILHILKDIAMFENNGHLWFLPTLFAIFIIFWVIEKILKKKTIYVLLVSFLLYIISLRIPDKYDTIIRYLFWFSVGYGFELVRRKYNKMANGNELMLFIISFVLTLAAYLLPSFRLTIFNVFVTNLTAMMGISMTYNFALYAISKLKYDENKTFAFIDRYSFDIYLYHDIFNFLILYLLSASGMIALINNTFSFMCLMIIKIAGVAALAVVVEVFIKELKRRISDET